MNSVENRLQVQCSNAFSHLVYAISHEVSMHKWVMGIFFLVVLVSCPTETTQTFYTVTATAGTGGIASPKSQKVLKGTSTVVTFTPNNGFLIQSISGTCPGISIGGRFATSNIKEDCTVEAVFKIAPPPSFTVTATAGAGGSVSPTTQEVIVGNTTTITVMPDANKVVESASGCGGSMNEGGASYTTGNINANCNISISFKVGTPTLGSIGFQVTGYGYPIRRTGEYRVSPFPNPIGGRPLLIWLKDNVVAPAEVPSAYNTWIDQKSAIMVAPQNIDSYWRLRMDGGENFGTARGADDVEFIKEIIIRATDTTNPLFGTGNAVNPNKVYVVGELGGGNLAYILYADPRTKNRISAIAPLFSSGIQCRTSNPGNGTLPYIPPSDADLICGESNGSGFFVAKSSLYTRTNPARILNVGGNSNQFILPVPAPELDNPNGAVIDGVKQWAITSSNCGTILPSANPVFTATIAGLNTKAYRQRNAANNAACPTDVTFFLFENYTSYPQGYEKQVVNWFFEKYDTLTNTFIP